MPGGYHSKWPIRAPRRIFRPFFWKKRRFGRFWRQMCSERPNLDSNQCCGPQTRSQPSGHPQGSYLVGSKYMDPFRPSRVSFTCKVNFASLGAQKSNGSGAKRGNFMPNLVRCQIRVQSEMWSSCLNGFLRAVPVNKNVKLDYLGNLLRGFGSWMPVGPCGRCGA